MNAYDQRFYRNFDHSAFWKLHPCFRIAGNSGDMDRYYVMAYVRGNYFFLFWSEKLLMFVWIKMLFNFFIPLSFILRVSGNSCCLIHDTESYAGTYY